LKFEGVKTGKRNDGFGGYQGVDVGSLPQRTDHAIIESFDTIILFPHLSQVGI